MQTRGKVPNGLEAGVTGVCAAALAAEAGRAFISFRPESVEETALQPPVGAPGVSTVVADEHCGRQEKPGTEVDFVVGDARGNGEGHNDVQAGGGDCEQEEREQPPDF